MTAKALCVGEQRKHAAEAADLAEMERGVQEIESRVKDLDQIQRSATTIKNGAETILKHEQKLRHTIEAEVEHLRDRISALRTVTGGAAGSQTA